LDVRAVTVSDRHPAGNDDFLAISDGYSYAALHAKRHDTPLSPGNPDRRPEADQASAAAHTWNRNLD